MPTTRLLDKLLEIERAVGRVDNTTLRTMIMDAEAHLLHIQRDVITVLEEVRRLREERTPQVDIPQAVVYAEKRRKRAQRKGEQRPALAPKPAFVM
jgi:hypothetical protein